MWACDVARCPYITNDGACGNIGTRLCLECAHMRIARISVDIRMIDEHLVAVTVIEVARLDNLPVKSADDRRALWIPKINASMELPSAVDWMDAPTERARDGEILSKRRANLEGEDGKAQQECKNDSL